MNKIAVVFFALLIMTIIGVAGYFGFASVIAMLTLGNGARAAVDATFASLGANQIQLGQRFSMQDGEFKPTGKNLTYSEGLDMASTLSLVERVEMSATKSIKARFGKNTAEITALGTTADALEGLISSGDVRLWAGHVKAIVESHSGRVEAQSAGSGMGSKFVVRIRAE